MVLLLYTSYCAGGDGGQREPLDTVLTPWSLQAAYSEQTQMKKMAAYRGEKAEHGSNPHFPQDFLWWLFK